MATLLAWIVLGVGLLIGGTGWQMNQERYESNRPQWLTDLITIPMILVGVVSAFLLFIVVVALLDYAFSDNPSTWEPPPFL